MGSSDLKGICRKVLGGEEGTLSEVFQNLSDPGSGIDRQDDAFWNASQWQVPLPSGEGTGSWRLIRAGEGFQAIVTECDFFSPRTGTVPAEGLVGLHFILDGPWELSGAGNPDRVLGPVTMLASHQAPGVDFMVSQPAGVSRMLTICLSPEILVDSFGLRPEASRIARRLSEPKPGSISIVEAKMPPSCATLLEELFAARFGQSGGLAASIGLMVLIVGHVVTSLTSEDSELMAGSYSLRDLRLLEAARQALAEDLDKTLSLAEIARRLGTNQTKLKTGLRAVYGITASGYRKQKRMIEAMRLLAEEQQPASVVAARIGYSAHASFTVAFRAYHGMTPRDARVSGRTGQAARAASP